MAIGFQYGVDASVRGGDGHWWFFKNKEDDVWAIKVSGDSVEKGPELITAEWAFPALKNTVFEHRIDASVTGGDGHWWFFSGDQAIKVSGDAREKGPEPITADDAFSALKHPTFKDGVDASVRGGDGHWWFFKNKEDDVWAIKVSGDSVEKGPELITAAGAFPALKNTVFEHRIDASVTGGDGHWWFFSGDQAIKVSGDAREKGPEPITADDAFSALRNR